MKRHIKTDSSITSIDSGRPRMLQNPLFAWAVVVVSMAVTIAAYVTAMKHITQRELERFEFRSNETISEIRERMSIYEQILRSGAALFNASGEVTREEWRTFVETIDVNKHWPGIQGIGYSVPVAPSDKEAHIQSIRGEGFPEYTIRPEGDRGEYSAIIYLEPFDWRNQRAFGFDMWSNDIRRKAMTRARDTGEPALSEMITLVQETNEAVQSGFLVYFPIYEKDKPLNSVEDRRRVFKGWVYSPFRAGNFMQGIIGDNNPGIDVEIFDGATADPDQMIFESGAPSTSAGSSRSALIKTEIIDLQGHQWTVRVSAPDGFRDNWDRMQVILGSLFGLVVNFLLVYVVWSIHTLGRRATIMAKELSASHAAKSKELEAVKIGLEEQVKIRTAELVKTQSELEGRVAERTRELTERISEIQRVNNLMVGRELKMMELKQEIERLKRSPSDG